MEIPTVPERLTIVDLVRHAHADWTPDEGRPLSARGRADAEALARRLGQPAIAAIYASPARRALATVAPLADACGLVPVVVHDLRERELLVPDGHAFEDAVAAVWARPEERVNGSESNRDAASRVRRVIDGVVARHRGDRVVISTHGNLLTLALGTFDKSFGHDAWCALTFPDVYRLTYRDGAFAGFARLPDDRARA